MEESILEIDNLSFSYDKYTNVFEDCSVKLKTEGITGIIGPNGAGKSTLFDLMLNQRTPTSGSILLKSNKILFMPQSFSLPYRLTVEECVDFLSCVRGLTPKIGREYLYNNFEEVELKRYESIKKRYFGKLSGGERMWLMVNCLLASDFDVALLDEPTVGIDPEFRSYVWKKILYYANRGKILFISSHILSELKNKVNTVMFIANKKIKVFDNMDHFESSYGGEDIDEAFIEASVKN